MKNLKNPKSLLALVGLTTVLASCGAQGGFLATNPAQAYRINLTPALGYEFRDGVYTVPSVTATLTSAPGAWDIYDVEYTAILKNSEGDEATGDNSAIVPAFGTLFARAQGGYRCVASDGTVTDSTQGCTINSPTVRFMANGQSPSNTITKAITPIEWAVAHNTGPAQDTATWYAEFTFRGRVNGQVVSWKQNFQFVAPAQ